MDHEDLIMLTLIRDAIQISNQRGRKGVLTALQCSYSPMTHLRYKVLFFRARIEQALLIGDDEGGRGLHEFKLTRWM